MTHARPLRAIACVVLALAAAGPRTALAVRLPTPRLLAQAQKQVDAGEFETALITLQDGLSSPDNANEELEQLYWRMGEVYVFLNRERAALDTFDRLFCLDAAYEAPRLTSPRVRKAFEKARADFLASGRQVTLRVPVQRVPLPDAPLQVEALVTGMRSDLSARVYFRPALTEAWQWAELRRDVDAASGRFVASLPAAAAGSSLEYYVEIAGPDRRRVQGEGSSLSPRTLTVAAATGALPAAQPPGAVAEPAGNWYAQGWIWGVVGAAVVVGGLVTYVALQSPPATLNLRVQVTP